MWLNGSWICCQSNTAQAGPLLTNQTNGEGSQSADMLPAESNAALTPSKKNPPAPLFQIHSVRHVES